MAVSAVFDKSIEQAQREAEREEKAEEEEVQTLDKAELSVR